MAAFKAAHLADTAGDFHSELVSLLKKYDVHPEDGKINLVTSDFTLRATDISNCKPECLMRTPVRHPDGTVTIHVWCSCPGE